MWELREAVRQLLGDPRYDDVSNREKIAACMTVICELAGEDELPAGTLVQALIVGLVVSEAARTSKKPSGLGPAGIQ